MQLFKLILLMYVLYDNHALCTKKLNIKAALWCNKSSLSKSTQPSIPGRGYGVAQIKIVQICAHA